MKIKRLPSGNYHTLIYSHTENGKRKYISVTDPDKKVVAQKAAEIALQKDKTSLSLGQAYDKYIASKDAVLSPTTIREYKRMRKTMLQSLMDIPLNKITQNDVQNAINQLAKDRSPKTVRNCHGLLVSVIGQYHPQLILRTKLPQRVKKEISIPTEDEVMSIYAVVKGTVMELPFLLASQLGMRASEIAALERKSFKENTVTVSQAMVWTGETWVLKQPKSYSGNRTIPCHENISKLAAVSEQYREIIPGKVFVIGLTPKDISHRWEHVLNKAKVKHFTFHSLRHYFASQALLQGIPKKYVAELMGHGSEDMLNRVYEHTFADEKYKMAINMVNLSDKLFSEKTANAK